MPSASVALRGRAWLLPSVEKLSTAGRGDLRRTVEERRGLFLAFLVRSVDFDFLEAAWETPGTLQAA